MHKIRPTPNSDSIKLCLRYTARDPRLRSKKSTDAHSSFGEVTGGTTASVLAVCLWNNINFNISP